MCIRDRVNVLLAFMQVNRAVKERPLAAQLPELVALCRLVTPAQEQGFTHENSAVCVMANKAKVGTVQISLVVVG